MCLALAAAVLGAGAGPRIGQTAVLNLPLRVQEHSQWCWDASSQAVLYYYGYTPSQCAIADWAWSLSDCCGSATFDWAHTCNLPNYLYGTGGSTQQILSHFGGIGSVSQASAFLQATVTAEINAGRPFVMAWTWYSGGGHHLVGRGIEGAYVYYTDPWPGEGYKIGSYSAVVDDGVHHWSASLRLTTSPSPAFSYRVLAGGDYAGDGSDDIAVYRPSSGMWSIRGHPTVYFGGPGAAPVPGDYDGDGTTEIGIFRPSNGMWSIRGITQLYFGGASDIPVPADYNADGSCDIGTFRPGTGLWSIRRITRVFFGSAGDKPVPVDFSGDHRAEIAIFRDTTGLWSMRGMTKFYFGSTGDIPVPADFNLAGFCRPVIFRPSTGKWAALWLGSFYFGGAEDIPLPGHYYGTSYVDYPAVFRPRDGRWSIYLEHNFQTYFGTGGDIPVTR
jgi:hypothetical protein